MCKVLAQSLLSGWSVDLESYRKKSCKRLDPQLFFRWIWGDRFRSWASVRGCLKSINRRTLRRDLPPRSPKLGRLQAISEFKVPQFGGSRVRAIEFCQSISRLRVTFSYKKEAVGFFSPARLFFCRTIFVDRLQSHLSQPPLLFL
jgi:hypothetical protein